MCEKASIEFGLAEVVKRQGISPPRQVAHKSSLEPWTLDLPELSSLLPSETAIQPLVVGDSRAAMALADALLAQGLWVPAIRPPTVPAGTARLRVSLSAAHTEADVDTLLRALANTA